MTKTVFSAAGLRPRARAASVTPAPGGQGGSSHAPERRVRQQPPVGKGAPAARQSRAYIPCPGGRGLRPRVRAALVPPAPGWQGGSSRAARAPLDTFLESTYPEMQRKHIPRVNEYQS